MRQHLIVSYEFVGKDFRRQCSSFVYGFDKDMYDEELASDILEEANIHAEKAFKGVYNFHNVCINKVIPIYYGKQETIDEEQEKENND